MNDIEGMTPIQDQDLGYQAGTPLAVHTPYADFIGGRSEYSMMGTPGYQGSMSPGYGVGVSSPAYGGRSPAYMSPAYNRSGQSPIYGATG